MKGTILKKLWFIASAASLRQNRVTYQDPIELDHKVNDLQDPQKDEERSPESNLSHQNCDEERSPESNFSDQNCLEDINLVLEENDGDESEQEHTEDFQEDDEERLISESDEKFPSGRKDLVIFYTTSLRGVRETFDACSRIKFLLDSYKISYQERDVSFDSDYRQELRNLLGIKVIPPRLFIKGEYIGGADEVMALNEQGKFRKILEGIPLAAASICDLCGNERFLICSACNGSSKVIVEDQSDQMWKKCYNCNEHGLVTCPVCS